MAQGDIRKISISDDGWKAFVEIEGMGLSGSVDPGFPDYYDTAFTASIPKITFNVTSLGFTDNGGSSTITRSIVATKPIRYPYPDGDYPGPSAGQSITGMDHYITGGNVVLKLALSDFIYAKDIDTFAGSNITANVLGSLYVSASINSAATSSFLVQNSSSRDYPQTIANWSWPGFERVSGSTFTLRACAFHRGAVLGRPVRFVDFRVSDNSGNSLTAKALNPIIDPNMPDQVPVIEYTGSFSTATLTQGEVLTCSFAAYPWYGDSGSILNTRLSPYSESSPYYRDIYLLNDKNNTYGVTIAVVDVNGADASGSVVDSASFSIGAPPTAYRTIGAAAAGIASYNNSNRSRNDVGAGIVYIKSGSYQWLGSSNSYGTTPKTWITIAKFPTESIVDVLLSGSSGNTDISDRIKFEEVSFTHTGNNGMTSGVQCVWAHKCRFSSSAQVMFNNSGTGMVDYYTHNQFIRFGQGMKAFGSNRKSTALARGNNFTTTGSVAYAKVSPCFTYIGNRGTKVGAHTVDDGNVIDSSTNAVNNLTASNVIYAFNKFQCRSVGASFSNFNQGGSALEDDGSTTHGAAIVQNLFENVESTATMLLWVAADANPGTPVNNILMWHNTLIGQRINMGYNDSGSEAKYKYDWSVKNNISDDANSKSDWFAGYGYGTGSRVGNWPIIHGVGTAYNFFGNVNGIGAAVHTEFAGINSIHRSDNYYQPSFQQYVDRQAATSTVDGAGGGNYKISGSSPLITGYANPSWLLPYDLEGNPRTQVTNFIGAYAYGTFESSSNSTQITFPSYSTLNSYLSAGSFTEGPSSASFIVRMDLPTGTTGSVTAMQLIENSNFVNMIVMTKQGALITNQFREI